ncbi:MAG: 4-alpha-glucanotransferase [Desulfovibrionaceae bacterium]
MPRTSGVLLHFTSLPSPFGVGDMGPEAVRFAEFLAAAGQRWWQVLPVGPTAVSNGNSPYSTFSAFAGHPLLLSPERLAEAGRLAPSEVNLARQPAGPHADFRSAARAKRQLLAAAFERAEPGLADDPEFNAFLVRNGWWLNDYALFTAVKEELRGQPWYLWPEDLRRREEPALRWWGTRLARPILREKFLQYLFFTQWGELRARLRELGVGLIGDAPIYVTLDSPDVWCNQELFRLGPDGRPTVVAGVPPDYFSKTGQRWGNPVYDWDAARRQGFQWWVARLRHNFGLFDQVRLDHFRAFAAYWAIPTGEKTAVAGRWEPTPGYELLATVRDRTGGLPLIAEDLGTITDDVRALRRAFGLPGMRVLQFAFGPGCPDSPHAPHNHAPDAVAYTGTHDNNTVRGWFEDDAGDADRRRLARYLGAMPGDGREAARQLVRLAWTSVAAQAMAPAQDLLGLDGSARMNTPGRARGNWGWRLAPGALGERLAAELAELTVLSGRATQRDASEPGEVVDETEAADVAEDAVKRGAEAPA